MASGRWKLTLLLSIFILLIAFILYNTSSPLAIYPEEAKEKLKDGQYDAVVDVRTDTEWNTGHYPLAIHVPTKDISTVLPQRIPDRKAKILFYCNTSTRARMAAEQAEKMGYANIQYLVGTHTNLM